MHCVISLGLYCPLVQLLEQVFVIIIIIFAGLSPITNIPIPATDVFVNVDTVIQNEWQSCWNLYCTKFIQTSLHFLRYLTHLLEKNKLL